MTLSTQEHLRTVVLVAMLAFMLGGCGSQDISRVRDNSSNNNGITAAIETDVSGKDVVYAAAPSAFESMSFCVLDQNSVCVDKIAMSFDRATEDRKIFRLPDSITLGKSIWKLIATKTDGSSMEQKVQLKQVESLPTGALNWKVLLMASDQGNTGEWINAFDNARKKLKQIFTTKGIQANNFRELSLHPDQQSQSVKSTSAANFLEAMKSFGSPAANDACLVHMTSHGSQDGFNLGSNRLSPSQLDEALVAGCGDRPTVVLVSACFSGLYVLDKSNLKKPNRIILTAARSDLTSFGCSSENEYTYWDSCLIESLPTSTKWKDLATSVVSCINRKEGGSTASFPQTFIGAGVADLDLPR